MWCAEADAITEQAPPLETARMTLVVGMQTKTCVYVAADSLVEENSVQLHDWRKVHPVEGYPLVWGWAGMLPDKRWIGPALQKCCQLATWWDFANGLANELASDTRQRVERLKHAGLGINPAADLTTLLVAGIVGAELAVATIDAKGQVTLAPENERILTIGSGSTTARIVARTLQLYHREWDEKFFRKLTTLSVGLSDHVGFPAHVLKVDESGVSELPPINGLPNE